MGNRAKKAKKSLVRPPKPAVTETPVKQAPEQVAAVGSPAVPPKAEPTSLNADASAMVYISGSVGDFSKWKQGKAPRLSLSSRPRHRISRLTTFLPDRKPSQSLTSFIDSLPQDVKKNVVEHYWATRRLISGSLPEIGVQFPDDAHLSDTAMDDYKKLVELQSSRYAEQLEIYEEHMWAPLAAMCADRWAWVKDAYKVQYKVGLVSGRKLTVAKLAQAHCAQAYYNDFKNYERAKLARNRGERAAKTHQNVQNMMLVGDHFQEDRYVGPDAVCIGRRFPWRNGYKKGEIYYNFLKSELDPVVMDTLQTISDYGPGNIPLAYGVAGEMAMDSAMYHRMYSETLGLWHHPLNPSIRSRLGLSSWSDIQTRSVALNLGYHYYQRSAHLKNTLHEMVELRKEHGIYHPSRSGDFHNGHDSLWVNAISEALNTYANMEIQDQFALKARILAGHDNTSWYAFDVRELGPIMNALRAYHDLDANLRTGGDVTIAPADEEGSLTQDPNELRPESKPEAPKIVDMHIDGLYDSIFIDTPKSSSERTSHLPKDLFVIDEQRALQGIAFHMEMSRLTTRLHNTIQDPEKRMAFLGPRSPDGRQAPRLKLDNNMRVRLRRKGDPEGAWKGTVPTVTLGKFLYEQLQHLCC